MFSSGSDNFTKNSPNKNNDSFHSNEEFNDLLITSMSDRVVQFISTVPPNNQALIANFSENLNRVVSCQTQNTNSINNISTISYKDALQHINFSHLSTEVAEFLKNLTDDVFVVTHFSIKENKEESNSSAQYKVLDYLANISQNGFEFSYKKWMRGKKKYDNKLSLDNHSAYSKNAFEDSLVTILLSAKRRLTSKEKVVFLDADYNAIIKRQRYDIINLLYIISSGIVFNCLDEVTSDVNIFNVSTNQKSGGTNESIVDKYLSNLKESIKTNLHHKNTNLREFSPHIVFLFDQRDMNDYNSNNQNQSASDLHYKKCFDEVLDRVDIVFIDKTKLVSFDDENHLNVLLSELNSLIYNDMVIKYFSNKHFTGITIYLLSSFLPLLMKFSELKIEKIFEILPTLEISEYFLLALTLYKNFTSTMVSDANKFSVTNLLRESPEEQDNYPKLQNEKNSILNQEELLEYLHSSKLDSFILFNSVYEKNKTLFSNEDYIKTFNFFKKELETEIIETESTILKSQLELSQSYCTSLLEEKIQFNMKKIESGVVETVEDFTKLIQTLFESYAKESRGRKKMSVFNEMMEKHWSELVDQFNLNAEEKYLEHVENFNEEIKKSSQQIKLLEREMIQVDEIYNVKNKELFEKKSELEVCDREYEYIQKQIEELEQELEQKREI